MSFFDEADEPRTAPRRPPRRRSPTGTTRRPPPDQQAIRMRRAVALVVLAILFVLVVVGVHSCQVSARNSALKDYNSNVVAIIQQSNATGRQFFGVLTGGGNPRSVQTSINEARSSADSQLRSARGFDVPDQVKTAQQNLLLALQMRRDAMANVGQNIQQALSGNTRRDAVSAIAAEMARLYASDVLYKDYTLPLVLGALKGAGIAIGGTDGQQVEAGQFVPDVHWVDPSFVASQLHVSLPGQAQATPAPGTHGHRLDSVTVGGNALDTASTNSLSASPPPTFTLHFENTGQNNETNVVCKVTIRGAGITGQTTVPQTTAGQPATCDVQLSSSPPAGSYTVAAMIEPVPGEKNTLRNTQTFPVTFK